MLPQLLSLLLPLIAANEIMMMQWRLMGAQPAQRWGQGRREGGSRLAAPFSQGSRAPAGSTLPSCPLPSLEGP